MKYPDKPWSARAMHAEREWRREKDWRKELWNENERLKEQLEAAQNRLAEVDEWVSAYQTGGSDAGGALDGIAETLDASIPATVRLGPFPGPDGEPAYAEAPDPASEPGTSWGFDLVRSRDGHRVTVTVPMAEYSDRGAALRHVWSEFDPGVWWVEEDKTLKTYPESVSNQETRDS